MKKKTIFYYKKESFKNKNFHEVGGFKKENLKKRVKKKTYLRRTSLTKKYYKYHKRAFKNKSLLKI